MPRRNRNRNRRSRQGEETDQVIAAGASLAGVRLNPPLSYPRQAFATIWVPGDMVHLLCTSGVSNGNTAISPFTHVRQWSSRFQMTFTEYRTLKIELKVRSTLPPSYTAGDHLAMIDEDAADTTATTAAMLLMRDTVLRPNDPQNPRSQYQLRWQAQDIRDLEFTPTASSFAPIRLRIAADPGSTSTDSTFTGNLLDVRCWFLIQFRGLSYA